MTAFILNLKKQLREKYQSGYISIEIQLFSDSQNKSSISWNLSVQEIDLYVEFPSPALLADYVHDLVNEEVCHICGEGCDSVDPLPGLPPASPLEHKARWNYDQSNWFGQN